MKLPWPTFCGYFSRNVCSGLEPQKPTLLGGKLVVGEAPRDLSLSERKLELGKCLAAPFRRSLEFGSWVTHAIPHHLKYHCKPSAIARQRVATHDIQVCNFSIIEVVLLVSALAKRGSFGKEIFSERSIHKMHRGKGGQNTDTAFLALRLRVVLDLPIHGKTRTIRPLPEIPEIPEKLEILETLEILSATRLLS